MTNLPRALRVELEEAVPFSTLSLEDEAHSADGTVKALFRTSDGHPVEAVLMRYRDGRRSICVSSQSGCPLTCTFCATGAMRFGRNLRASEILDQVLHFRRIEPVNHLVFMGMGEPFLNVDEVLGRGTAAAADRDHAPADDDLDRGLDAGSDAVHRRGRRADPARALHPRGRSAAALRADARERSLPLAGRARRVPPLLRAAPPQGLRGVRDARRRERLAGPGEGARGIARPESLQGQPDPVQPDRDGQQGIVARRRSPRSRQFSISARVPSTVRLTRGRDIQAACGQLAASPRN